MTVKRMDNVGIVVADIDAAIEFFTEAYAACFPSERQRTQALRTEELALNKAFHGPANAEKRPYTKLV